MYKGVSQNDVGIRTDVIGNINKKDGMNMLRVGMEEMPNSLSW